MTYDVLIVGAGPVGLMLAAELARRGVSHRVIESKASRERYCKALGVSPRSLEVFDHMGLLDEALRVGFFFNASNVVYGGELQRRVEMSELGDLPYGHFSMAQPCAEDILEDLWLRHGGEGIARDTSLESFFQDESGVTATLSGGETQRARYMVGCDGAHSTVRKALGTAFEGARFSRTFLLGDVHLSWDRPHRETWQFIRLENGELRDVVTAIPNPTGPGRYRLSSSIDDADECSEHPPLEFLQQMMGPALPEGTVLSDLRWSSRYSISHRIASEYRTGRVFLAGDAAHIHPPIGGLGMNTGLQDAFNLGWKLAAVCQGGLPETILETYHEERHPVGARVVQVTAARMSRAMGEGDGGAAPEPPQFDTQLRIRYEPGALVGGETPAGGLPRPGDRLPGVRGLRRVGVSGEARLPELFRDGRFHLFTRGVDHEAFRAAAESALGGRLVRCWAILDEEPSEALGCLLDSAGEWDREVGVGAVLARPDNVIGWRGKDAEAFSEWLAGFALKAALVETAT